jgi:hypothetical protein
MLMVGLFPVVSATSGYETLSAITFKQFSEFVEHNFSLKFSMATVLVVLFMMTNNSDFFNLHAQ